MSPLITMYLLVVTTSDLLAAGTRSRLARMRGQDAQAGLSTLEITIIALGLFLLAGVAVLALTNATNTRLNQIQ